MFVVIYLGTRFMITTMARNYAGRITHILLQAAIGKRRRFNVIDVKVTRAILVLSGLRTQDREFLHRSPFVNPKAKRVKRPCVTATSKRVTKDGLVRRRQLLLLVKSFDPKFCRINVLPNAMASISRRKVRLVLRYRSDHRNVPFLFNDRIRCFRLRNRIAINVLRDRNHLRKDVRSVFKVNYVIHFYHESVLRINFEGSVAVVRISRYATFEGQGRRENFQDKCACILDRRATNRRRYSGRGVYSFLRVRTFLI